MEKSVRFSIFYNYNALGDVLILSKNLSSKFHHLKQSENVVALYDKDNNLYGYNIFGINKLIKLYYKGLLSYPFDYVVDIINTFLTKAGFTKIPYYNFSGIRVGVIKDINKENIVISFSEEEIIIKNKNFNLSSDDIILYAYPNVLLPSLRRVNNIEGEILKEIDLFNDGLDEYIKLNDKSLIGKDFYKGEIEDVK